MKLIECLHTESRCWKYKGGDGYYPAEQVGILLHTTGVNNPTLKRYTQPSKDDPRREELLRQIGKNVYNNHWNRNVYKAVHYFIGKLADGSIATVHNIPLDYSAWGVGKGKKGSYNYNPTAHIQFEICEDNCKNYDYFLATKNEAVELCVLICLDRGWDSSVITSHNEARLAGYANSHVDPTNWWKNFGYTMDDFRAEVQTILDGKEPKEIEVGDTVEFTGTKQWTNANKLLSKKATPCKAVVKQIYMLGKSKHPYLVKGSGVYGWVNIEDVHLTKGK